MMMTTTIMIMIIIMIIMMTTTMIMMMTRTCVCSRIEEPAKRADSISQDHSHCHTGEKQFIPIASLEKSKTISTNNGFIATLETI